MVSQVIIACLCLILLLSNAESLICLSYRRSFLHFFQICFQDCIVEDFQLRLFHSICKLLESSLSPLKANGGLWTVTHSGREIFFGSKSEKTSNTWKLLPLCAGGLKSPGKWLECFFSDRNPSTLLSVSKETSKILKTGPMKSELIFGAATSGKCQETGKQNPLWSKNVTWLTGSTEWPFRCFRSKIRRKNSDHENVFLAPLEIFW